MPDIPIIPETSKESPKEEPSTAQADMTQNRFAEQYKELRNKFHELCAECGASVAILVIKPQDAQNEPMCFGVGHVWQQAVLAAQTYRLKKIEAIEELDSIVKL